MDASARPALATVDVVLIAAYFVMVAAVGLFFLVRERRAAAANQGSSDDFFLAGRSMRWPAIGFSLFASNIGSEHLLGLAGSAAAGGLAVGWFEWSAGIHILVLGHLFAPIYIRSGIATLPEYLERRYDRRMRTMLSCVSLFIYVFTKLSVSVFSAATVLHSVFGWDRYVAAVGMVALTALYTVAGGLSAVIVTDVAQSIVLILGASCMAVVGLRRVGGWQALQASPPASLTPQAWSEFFRIYRPPDHANYPTLGLLLGSNVGGLWYRCLDQAIAQRVLSARSATHATTATVLAGYLKILPVFIMVVPGVCARRLFDAELGCVAGGGCPGSNEAYPLLLKNLLPPGLLGLNLAATVAACMSSLDSVFTAAASLFCLDIYRPHLRPAATDMQLVAAGRYILTGV